MGKFGNVELIVLAGFVLLIFWVGYLYGIATAKRREDKKSIQNK